MTAADRRRRVALAGHSGDPEAARAGLGDPDPAVRATALGALERLGALGDDELSAAASDLAPVVRRRAASLAARHRGVELGPLLADADAGVVEVAAWACGERVDLDGATLDRLIGLAGGHDDPLVREAAVAALGAIGDPAGFEAISRGLADVAPVRRRAVLALAPFVADGDHVDELLRTALTDRDWQVRQAAEDLLSVDPRHEPP